MSMSEGSPSSQPLPSSLPPGRATADGWLFQLHPDSTLQELPVWAHEVARETPCSAVAGLFSEQSALPGVLVMRGGEFLGMVSRHTFFRRMSQPYSQELFARKPIGALLVSTLAEPLMLPADCRIDDAARQMLLRPAEDLSEPILVIRHVDRAADRAAGPVMRHCLLDAFVLLRAQARMLSVANDIIHQQKLLAETSSKHKSQFLANVSHEIRTPLNGIMGMAELALDTALSAEQREYVELVRVSAEGLLAVINDILDFSKIEAGRLELSLAPFRLRPVVFDALRPLALRAAAKGIEVVCQVDADCPDHLLGDSHRLQQVLVNLVGNAVKFTHTGHIALRVTTADSNHPPAPGQTQLHFQISDTGIGIAEDKLSLIFQPFVQADGSTTRKYGGTGLGLSICQNLVRLLGGRLWVDSVAGSGSTFHFTTSFQQLPDVEAVAPSHLAGLSVLVADDNPAARTALVELLTAWHLQPTAAATAAEAAHLATAAAEVSRPFHFAMVDAHIAGNDPGDSDLSRRLTQLARMHTPDPTRVFLMIAPGSPSHRAFAEPLLGRSVVAGVITKPPSPSELLNLLTTARHRETAPIAPVMPRSPAAAEAVGPAYRVLVAEDNPVNQRVAQRLLERLGHSVTLAANGRQALAALESSSAVGGSAGGGGFDLIFLDLQMPDLGGLETIAEIRRRPSLSGLPAIAMTAHAITGDRERCLAAGMDGYVSKPVRPSELAAEISRVMRLRASGGRGQAAPALANEGAAACDLAAALVRADDDPELLAELIELFLRDAPSLLDQLEQTTGGRAPDFGQMSRLSHKLRGMIGVFEAAEAVSHLDRLDGQIGSRTAVGPAAGEFLAAARRLCQYLGSQKNKFQ
jgi:signal transduction histidine kinase/CheY-like chemotaxis protein